MNKQETLRLFQSCPADSPLAPIARLVAEKITKSNSFGIGGGGKLQEASHYLEIYEHRLKHAKNENLNIPGLEESVEVFKQLKGKLDGRYIESDQDLIYFWMNEDLQLVGCILGKDARKTKNEPPREP